jgi:hypothetical protein
MTELRWHIHVALGFCEHGSRGRSGESILWQCASLLCENPSLPLLHLGGRPPPRPRDVCYSVKAKLVNATKGINWEANSRDSTGIQNVPM